MLAEKARLEDEVPVGAVIVHEGQIIGRGWNQKEGPSDPCGHAEILAIRDAGQNLKSWRLIGATLFVTLEPCPMCLAACQQARIQKVIYGAKDLKGGALSLGYLLHADLRTNHRFEVEYHEEPESQALLKAFFKQKRHSNS